MNGLLNGLFFKDCLVGSPSFTTLSLSLSRMTVGCAHVISLRSLGGCAPYNSLPTHFHKQVQVPTRIRLDCSKENENGNDDMDDNDDSDDSVDSYVDDGVDDNGCTMADSWSIIEMV